VQVEPKEVGFVKENPFFWSECNIKTVMDKNGYVRLTHTVETIYEELTN